LSRFVYLDEAGISSRQQEPWLIVAGLVVHGDTQLNKLYRELEAVTAKHIPTRHREAGLKLHASDIYGGNGKFDEKRDPQWTLERRMAILKDLAEIPNKANILITSGAVEKAKFPTDMDLPLAPEDERQRAGNKKERPVSITVQCHAAAYMACLIEVDVWLQKNAKNENCMVIVEDNNEARAAIKQVHHFSQSKSMPLPEDLRRAFPLTRVREDPAFQEKRPDHPLILADFVAFMVKRLYMKDPKISPFFRPWKERFSALALQKNDRLRD
jgi:hypothetical protein